MMRRSRRDLERERAQQDWLPPVPWGSEAAAAEATSCHLVPVTFNGEQVLVCLTPVDRDQALILRRDATDGTDGTDTTAGTERTAGPWRCPCWAARQAGPPGAGPLWRCVHERAAADHRADQDAKGPPRKEPRA